MFLATPGKSAIGPPGKNFRRPRPRLIHSLYIRKFMSVETSRVLFVATGASFFEVEKNVSLCLVDFWCPTVWLPVSDVWSQDLLEPHYCAAFFAQVCSWFLVSFLALSTHCIWGLLQFSKLFASPPAIVITKRPWGRAPNFLQSWVLWCLLTSSKSLSA